MRAGVETVDVHGGVRFGERRAALQSAGEGIAAKG